MAKKSFLPRSEAEKSAWLNNFAAKLPTYAAKYLVPTAVVTAIQQDAAVYKYFLDYTNQVAEYTRKLTQFKKELSQGANTNLVVPTLPAAPVSPFPPSAGIFRRASSWANIIKKSLAYLESDGLDLGLEGSELSASLRSVLKPTIALRLIEGGRPEIVWQKGQADGIEIYVDRGSGTFEFLNIDLKPNYIDIAPLPATGVAQVWKYRAIYRLDDHSVGQWSDTVEISVKGGV